MQTQQGREEENKFTSGSTPPLSFVELDFSAGSKSSSVIHVVCTQPVRKAL